MWGFVCLSLFWREKLGPWVDPPACSSIGPSRAPLVGARFAEAPVLVAVQLLPFAGLFLLFVVVVVAALALL